MITLSFALLMYYDTEDLSEYIFGFFLSFVFNNELYDNNQNYFFRYG